MPGFSVSSEPNQRLWIVAGVLGLVLIASLWYAFSPSSKPVLSEALDDPKPEYHRKSADELKIELKEASSQAFSYREALDSAGLRIEELSHEVGRLRSSLSSAAGSSFPTPRVDVRPLRHETLKPSSRQGWEAFGEFMNFGEAPAEGFADIQLLVGLVPVEGTVTIRMGPIPPGGRQGYQAIFDYVKANPRNPEIQVNASWRPLSEPPRN